MTPEVQADEAWSAVLDLCRELGPVSVGQSSFADKPALFLGRREWVDLRLAGAADVERLRPLFEIAVRANG